MPNPKHLKVLQRGVNVWNKWRDKNPNVRPNLSAADFSYADLAQINLSRVNLRKANLTEANFEDADLSEADLCEADFYGAELIQANLSKAQLQMTKLHRANLHFANAFGANLSKAQLIMAEASGADFREANLNRALLTDAELYKADLRGANLSGADLGGASLKKANLTEANLDACRMVSTILADIDLSQARNLKTVEHAGPSTIGIDTIFRSNGQIPEVFLRGTGVPDVFIANARSLIGAMSPVEFCSCFISYSSKDQEFAERFYADLQAKGVRCWYAPEDLKIGDKLRQRIDDAIRLHDKLLVVLSETSVASSWVGKEVEAAFEKENGSQSRIVLFPIRLDEAVMRTGKAWAADIRRTRHIGDFSHWRDHNSYQKAFSRLLRDLQGEKTKDGEASG